MLILILKIIKVVGGILLLSYGVISYLAKRKSVKLRNEPSYMIWRTTYCPKKIIIEDESKETSAYISEVKTLNKLIDLMILNVIILFTTILIGVIFQEFIVPK